jgi:hypothetical protein
MHALWSWRQEHCPRCHQHRPSWLDDDGKELRDPPFDIAEDFCPACAWMQDWETENPVKDRPAGTAPFWKPVDYEDEPPGDDESAA